MNNTTSVDKKVFVRVNEVCKVFDIGKKTDGSFLFKLVNFISGRESKKDFRVLDKVNFNIRDGQKVALIGKNGAGKSTLLKVISGIQKLDSGSVEVVGSSKYISGYSHGLKPKLSMKDNIFILSTVLGLNKKQSKDVFDKVIEFTELYDFVDTKVYQFSTGMISKLVFSVAIFSLEILNPDIIFIDEVLGSGGDVFFKEKALKKIEDLIEKTKIVIFVTHSTADVKKYANHIIWIDNGLLVKEGSDVNGILNDYLKNNKL
jgi:ABC-type polysaccharide/polyol phosphate transport system ATPase subunit